MTPFACAAIAMVVLVAAALLAVRLYIVVVTLD
jgi:hypothetical protein